MNKVKNLYCIVGKSGVGKTTAVDRLENEYGYKVLKSYATRKPRHEGDTDHTFISVKEYDELQNKVASCEFNGNFYAATAEQIEESDLYVIDCQGIKDLKENYKGDKRIIVIQLTATVDECLDRMLKRGDSEEKVWDRLRHDYFAFKDADELSNYRIPSDSAMAVVATIKHIIDYEEVK